METYLSLEECRVAIEKIFKANQNSTDPPNDLLFFLQLYHNCLPLFPADQLVEDISGKDFAGCGEIFSYRGFKFDTRNSENGNCAAYLLDELVKVDLDEYFPVEK